MKNNRNVICLCLLFPFGLSLGAIRKRKSYPELEIEKTKTEIEEDNRRYNFCPKCGYQSYEFGNCPNCNKELISPKAYSKTQDIEIHGNDLEDLEYTYEQGLVSEEKYQELKTKILEKMKERKEVVEKNVNSEFEEIRRRQFREIQKTDLLEEGDDDFIEEDELEKKEEINKENEFEEKEKDEIVKEKHKKNAIKVAFVNDENKDKIKEIENEENDFESENRIREVEDKTEGKDNYNENSMKIVVKKEDEIREENNKENIIKTENMKDRKELRNQCPRCLSENLKFYEGNMVRCNDCKKIFVGK